MVGHQILTQSLIVWRLVSIFAIIGKSTSNATAFCYDKDLSPIKQQQTNEYGQCMYNPSVVESGQIFLFWSEPENKVTSCLNNKACFAACNIDSCLSLGFAQEVIDANMWLAKIFCSMALGYLLVSVGVIVVLSIRVGFQSAKCSNKIHEIVEKSLESLSSDHESNKSHRGTSLNDFDPFKRFIYRRSHLQESLLKEDKDTTNN